MSTVPTIYFKHAHSEDVDDVLNNLRNSINPSLAQRDFEPVRTFGELCNLFVSNINTQYNDCTSQQAFYRLRLAIADTINCPVASIVPTTSLESLFPAKTRRAQIAKLKEHLGIKAHILRPRNWVFITSLLSLLLSFIALCGMQNWSALLTFIASILFTHLVHGFANQFKYATVGELTNDLTKHHYSALRRNPATANPVEVVEIIKTVFEEDLFIDRELLTENAVFKFT